LLLLFKLLFLKLFKESSKDEDKEVLSKGWAILLTKFKWLLFDWVILYSLLIGFDNKLF